jgi:predicted amidohydrolase YtcJ
MSLFLVGLCAGASRAEDAADLILRGGVLHTVAPEGQVRGSLAVRGARIVYVGDDAGAERLRGPATRVVELRGRSVTPGLIDAHAHLLGLGASLVQVDLAGAPSFEEVVERVRAAASRQPAGSWIEGRGWDQTLWPGREFPHHAALSAAVPEHPVWVRRVDGHAGLANARAMASLGIDAGTPDPAGGRLLRDAEGHPTGVFVDNAMDLVAARLPPPSPEELRRRLELATAHCLAVGLTTVTDLGVDEAGVAAYAALRRDGALPLRAALFLEDERALLATWLARGPELDPEARLTVRGIKLYADGALGSRGAALLEPYADEPGNIGLLVSDGDHLAEVARLGLERGFQVGIHAIGDRGAVVALDAMERALGGPRPQARFRLEHAQVLRLQDVDRLARLGVIASMQPTHATSDMRWAQARVGPRRLAGAYAWRKVLRAGGRLALGSDFPVESADPRLGLYAAITRQDLAGEPAGGWLPEERLSLEEALRGFTLDAAYSLFLDQDVGSLAVGKRADLVVFGGDLTHLAPRALAEVPVDATLVDGRVAYERGGAL